MSNEIYETENGEMVADCKLCEKQILLETDEYYQVGIFHKSPMICDGSMDTKGFLHTKCYEEVAEGLIETELIAVLLATLIAKVNV